MQDKEIDTQLFKDTIPFLKAGTSPVFKASIHSWFLFIPLGFLVTISLIVTSSLAGGGIIHLDFLFLLYSGYFPIQDTCLCPTFSSAGRATLFAVTWQRSQLRVVPRAVSKFGLPKGISLKSSRHALIQTHFHSSICSNTWFLPCLSKPRWRQTGGEQLFYLYYTRHHFLYPLSNVLPPNLNWSLRIKGERPFFQTQETYMSS